MSSNQLWQIKNARKIIDSGDIFFLPVNAMGFYLENGEQGLYGDKIRIKKTSAIIEIDSGDTVFGDGSKINFYTILNQKSTLFGTAKIEQGNGLEIKCLYPGFNFEWYVDGGEYDYSWQADMARREGFNTVGSLLGSLGYIKDKDFHYTGIRYIFKWVSISFDKKQFFRIGGFKCGKI